MCSHVNVQPQRVSGADVGDGLKGVDGSVHGGSRCGVHVEGNQTLEHGSRKFQSTMRVNVVLANVPLTCLGPDQNSDFIVHLFKATSNLPL